LFVVCLCRTTKDGIIRTDMQKFAGDERDVVNHEVEYADGRAKSYLPTGLSNSPNGEGQSR